ncbi:MAG: hypothetical protein KIS72_05720, partial [Luteimonas sp.]|nr:hypothetical protein [Luteimonas sp.]
AVDAGSETAASADPAPAPDPAPAAAADAAAPAGDGDAAGDGAASPDEARNTDADVDLALDNLHGNHKPFRDAFDRLKQGLAAGDKAAVAALVVYPLEVTIDGKKRKIANAGQFTDAWDKIVTAEVAQAVARQEYRDAFVNWQGLMVGEGEVWIGDVCRDKECKKVDVGVTAFQSEMQAKQ